MVKAILSILSNLTSLFNKTPDKENKERQAAKTDVKIVKYNEDEIEEMFQYIKKHRKLMWKAKGIKYGLFKKKPPLIAKDETIEGVYFDLVELLENKQ